MKPQILLGLLGLTLLTLIGCREDWEAVTYPAAGDLTINGQPATGALVELIPQGAAPDVRNSRPWGKVDAAGHFELATYQGKLGAPPGEYRVTITWPVDSAMLGSPDRLGSKFAQAEKSRLTATIRAEATVLPPIHLSGIKVTENPRIASKNRVFQP